MKVKAPNSLEPPQECNQDQIYCIRTSKQRQQHKQLETMEMTEAWPDTFNEEYIHQFLPEPTHKIYWQQ